MRHECGGTLRRDVNENGYFYTCRSCMKKVDAPNRTRGSGQIAGLPYRAQLAREILAKNAQARAAVDAKVKATYYGRNHD